MAVEVTVVASASIVAGNEVVTLDSTVVNPDGETLTYLWAALPNVGTFADDDVADTTWTAPVQDHQQDVTLILTAFYGTQAVGTPFRFGGSLFGGSHVLGGTSSSGRASLTVRASVIAEAQTLTAFARPRRRPRVRQAQFLAGQTVNAAAAVNQPTAAQHQILSDQRLLAAAAILSAPTVTQTIPTAVLTAQTVAAAATLSAPRVVAPDPFAVLSAQTVSATAVLDIPTVSVQDAGTNVLIAETIAATATLPTPTAVAQSPVAAMLALQSLVAEAALSQPTLVAQAPVAGILAFQTITAATTVSESTLRQSLPVAAQTVDASAALSQPMLLAQGPGASVLAAQTLAAAASLSQPAKVLTLDDFNDGGQLVDVLALLSANLSQANRLFIGPSRGGSDTPLDGELGISPSQTLISRVSRIGALILINDNNDPQTLALSAWFGSSNTVSDWTLTIQTADGVASTNQLGTTGGNAARFDFTGHPNIGIINNISADTRFLFGLTRTVLASQTVNGIATLSSPTVVAQGAGDATLQAQTVGAVGSLRQPILSRHLHIQTVVAEARISEPTLSQQTPTDSLQAQTVESSAALTTPALQATTATATVDAQAVAAAAQLSQPTVEQVLPTGNLQGRTARATARLRTPTLAQQLASVALDAQTLAASAAIPTPTLQQQQIGTITLAGQTVDAEAALQAPTARAIPPDSVATDGQTVSASASLGHPTLTQTIPTVTLQAQTLTASALILEPVLRHIPPPVALAGQTVDAVAALSQPTVVESSVGAEVASAQTLSAAAALSQPSLVATGVGAISVSVQTLTAFATLSQPSVTTTDPGAAAATSQTITATAALSRPTLTQIALLVSLDAQTLTATALITSPALRQVLPAAGVAGQTVAASALVRQPALRQVPPPDVASAQTLAAVAQLRQPRVVQTELASTLQSQTVAATASLSQPTLQQQGAGDATLSAQTLIASARLRQPRVQQGTITAVVLSAQTLAAVAVLPQPVGRAGAAIAAVLRAQPVRAFIFSHAPALDRPPNLALEITAGAATPIVHLGWTLDDTLVAGNSITELNGIYAMGGLDSETTRITGPEPEYVITYTDTSNVEWIVFSMLDVRYSYRVIADGATGTFTVGTIPKPDGDIQYSLAVDAGLLTADMNGLVFDISAIGDASAGTLTLYADGDTAKNQRVRFRSSATDYDWYGDIPFLRYDPEPRTPQVAGRPHVRSGKDGLRSLHPFRVPSASAQIRIPETEYISQPWTSDDPVAMLEAYADAKALTTQYRSEFVGRIERPAYEQTYIGSYINLSMLGNTAGLLDVVVETARHDSISARNAIVAVADAVDWPAAFRAFDITSLNAPTLFNWWETRRNAIRALQALLDTSGPPSQMYENRKGQLAILGTDWVVNIARNPIRVSAAAGIDVYDYRRQATDVESQINAAVQEVETWEESSAASQIWQGSTIVVLADTSATFVARFRDPVISVEQPIAGTDYTNTGTGTATVVVQNVRARQADIVVTATGGTVLLDTLTLNGTILENQQRLQVQVVNQTSIDDLGSRREWPGEILPSLPNFDANSLLQHLVDSYDESIVSGSLQVRLEDDYAVLRPLEHLYQVNSIDADGNTFDGFVREQIREWTTTGTFLSLVLEQDRGVLSRGNAVWRFGASLFNSNDFLWV